MISLHALLDESVRSHPRRVAVEDPERGVRVTYRELEDLAANLAARLIGAGVATGDRVGLCAPKSVGVVAALFGALRAGGAYVPVDADSPGRRQAMILDDCAVRTVVLPRERLAPLQAESAARYEVVDELDDLRPFGPELVLARASGRPEPDSVRPPDGLSYILYTSGSTGRPKGVVHTHASALSFLDWCSATLAPTPDDRFSSHAPLHFDLSILDLFVPLRHGARLVLIGEEAGKQPARLAPLIAGSRLTVWYSTPSILRLLVEFGRLEQHDCGALRFVLFAGEVFPVKHLRALQALWPRPRYLNLYGPTETNVCTWFELPAEIPHDRTESYPIGRICSGDDGRVVDGEDRDVPDGEEGELLVAGGSVMTGYWNLPERDARAFHVDAAGRRWHRTGDVVRRDEAGDYVFLGRRDRMVKRRGYRVELGEIESALYRHPSISEAAVIAAPDADGGVLIRAFLTWNATAAPSQIALKQFCAGNLPAYMIPDRFSVQPSLPRTSTDKIDYQRLREMA